MEVTIRELFTSAMILLIWYRFLDDRLSFRCVLLSLRLCTMVLLFFFARVYGILTRTANTSLKK